MRSVVFVAAALLVVGVATSALAQAPAGKSVLPAGFSITIDKTVGPAVVGEARKPNASCPKPHSTPDIVAGYSWQPNPAATQSLAIIEKAPEDPASMFGMTKTEPAGKQPYRGGVLIWKKSTTPWVGAGKGEPLVTYSGGWVGAFNGGLLGVSIGTMCGPKEAALALIDGMLDKVIRKK